jgi:hypothetical protein
MILVVLAELELGYWHSTVVEAFGVLLFVAEWFALAVWGGASLRRAGKLPWIQMMTAHLLLALIILLGIVSVIGLRRAGLFR